MNTGPPPAPPLVLRVLAAGAVSFALLAAVASAWGQGETYDEPAHIAYARRLLSTGETERVSVLHYNSKTPGSLPAAAGWEAAKGWLGVRGERLLFWARLPTVALLGALLLSVYLLGRRLLGETAALLATLACALDPNLIANASLATVDLAYALAVLLTLGSMAWAMQRPSAWRGLAVGAALGLAFAVKFSAFLLLPGLAVALLLPAWRARLGLRAAAGGILLGGAACLLTLSAAYGFRDVGVEVNDVGWRSPAMLRLHALLPHLRLPLPADVLTGFDVLAVAVDKDYPVVLLDRHHPRGVFHYFAVLWVLKTPVLLLAALAHGLARVAATGALVRAPALLFLAANLALQLLWFSVFLTAQVGYRFVLMCVPLAALLAAAGLAPALRRRVPRRLAVVVVLASVAEQVPYLGNHLAYTSTLLWPKEQAFLLLNNANLDWGQNDHALRGRLAREGLEDAPFNPPHALPGDNVLSVNALAGVGKFEQHRWLRRHLRPREHFDHTHLRLTVSPALYERMMDEDRRLGRDARRCEGAAPAGTVSDGAAAPLPDLGRTEAVLLCLTTAVPLDVGLFAEEGTAAVGPADQRLRDQPLLRPGQQAWFRLDPGPSALSAFAASGFRGRWAVRGGEAALSTRRVPVEAGALAEEDPPLSPP